MGSKTSKSSSKPKNTNDLSTSPVEYFGYGGRMGYRSLHHVNEIRFQLLQHQLHMQQIKDATADQAEYLRYQSPDFLTFQCEMENLLTKKMQSEMKLKLHQALLQYQDTPTLPFVVVVYDGKTVNSGENQQSKTAASATATPTPTATSTPAATPTATVTTNDTAAADTANANTNIEGDAPSNSADDGSVTGADTDPDKDVNASTAAATPTAAAAAPTAPTASAAVTDSDGNEITIDFITSILGLSALTRPHTVMLYSGHRSDYPYFPYVAQQHQAQLMPWLRQYQEQKIKEQVALNAAQEAAKAAAASPEKTETNQVTKINKEKVAVMATEQNTTMTAKPKRKLNPRLQRAWNAVVAAVA